MTFEDTSKPGLSPRENKNSFNNNGSDKTSVKEKSREKEKSGIKKYWWLIPVLGLVAAIGGVTFVRLQEDEPPAVTETVPLSVRAVRAQQEPIQAWISTEGRVRAATYQHLTFEVEGDVTYLANINGRRLQEGDRVTKGQLLARIDDRELVADVTQAQAGVFEAQQQQATAAAEVAQAQAQVTQARSQVEEAQARLRQAQSASNLARTNLERYRQLVEEGVVAEIEFDQRQNTFEDTQAQIQSAQASVDAAQQQVALAQAQVRAAQEQFDARTAAITTAQARLEQAQVALEGASIYAPFDGIIAYLNYTEGEYFTPQVVTSQLGGDYQGILERIPMVIIDPTLYEVIVDLAGSTGEQVSRGQEAFIAAETDVDTVLPQKNTFNAALETQARASGQVFAVNPAISPGGRAITARIRLNPQTTEDIRHGERVLTWIAVAEDPQAVVVPLNAVVRRDQIPYIFVVNDQGIVEQREVELGITGITKQEIESGVEPGELVVTDGLNRLTDGTSVQIINNGG